MKDIATLVPYRRQAPSIMEIFEIHRVQKDTGQYKLSDSELCSRCKSIRQVVWRRNSKENYKNHQSEEEPLDGTLQKTLVRAC